MVTLLLLIEHYLQRFSFKKCQAQEMQKNNSDGHAYDVPDQVRII